MNDRDRFIQELAAYLQERQEQRLREADAKLTVAVLFDSMGITTKEGK